MTAVPTARHPHADALALLDEDDLLRIPDEAALAAPQLAVLADEAFAPLAQRDLLRLVGGRAAQRWTARVQRRPLTVFSTGRGRVGLDLLLAERDCDGYLAVAGGDWKKRNGPPQVTSLAQVREPAIPEARRLHRAVQRSVARGDIDLTPHPYVTCACFFFFGGGSHRDKVRTTRAIKRAVAHCLPQTVGLGYLSATAAARPVDAAGAVIASDEQISRIDPDIGGVMLPVDPLAGGLRGFYGSVDALTFASRWNAGAVQADLLHAWARSAAAQQRHLPAASRARLILAVARLWMGSDWSVCTWGAELRALVPPALGATWPCPHACA